MKKGIIITILLLLLISISFPSSLKIKNDETIYALLDYDGKVKRVDLVNWIEIEGNGRFNITKDAKYLKNIKLFTEDVKLSISSQKINLSGNSQGHKNIYLTSEVNRKLPMQFKISYKYNGKTAKPQDFLGKSGDLDIEFEIETLEDIPFVVVISAEFSTDDFILRNPEDWMVMVLGKTIRLSGFSYPIPKSSIKLAIRGKNLKVPDFTFSALPSIPPVDLSITSQLGSFTEGLDGLILLNQVHQKILKGIIENFEKQSFSIPPEFLTLPFTLKANQNKAYAISNSLKKYPESFEKLYTYIKEEAEGSNDEKWQKALNMAEDVKKEIEGNSFSEDVKSIGDFIGDIAFSSQKAMNMISTSLEGLQKVEELLNIVLNGGELEGQKVPGLTDVEKNLKATSKTLKENISKATEGEKKMEIWKKNIANYNFAGKVEGASSTVRFYFKLEELRK
ncbi:MAG TPA: hypothetical protein PKW23_06735 [Dictyoglomaceae bacterium]|nr:hypothetical protein [Dictyoglomaceae bacterium]HOL39983.1 hypothetical protein [Dictyoglomaceae bacterium]HPP16573.1 hypothetical protein [Dictyoglomaceae bacterium]